MLTGATSAQSEPMKAPSPTWVSVLVEAVVVAEDRARADVGARAHRRRRRDRPGGWPWRPRPTATFFTSTKLPMWASCADVGARPQPREGADRGRRSRTTAPSRWLKLRITAPASTLTPGANTTCGSMQHARRDLGVPGEEDGLGRGHGHALRHQPAARGGLENAVRPPPARPGSSTPSTSVSSAQATRAFSPPRARQADHVGQIVFALGVVVPHLGRAARTAGCAGAARTPELQAVTASSCGLASLASTIFNSASPSPSDQPAVGARLDGVEAEHRQIGAGRRAARTAARSPARPAAGSRRR